MMGAQMKRRERGLESPEVLADWQARCTETRQRHADHNQALETLDSREGDALDVATFLRGEGAAVYF